MKALLLLALLIFLVSCGQDKDASPDSISKLDPLAFEKIQKSVCLGNEELVEVDFASTRRVYDTVSDYKAFGFYKPESACVLNSSYVKNSNLNEAFSLTFTFPCLESGSMWTVKSISKQDNTLYATFTEVNGADPLKEIKLRSAFSVALKNLTNEVGLHFYKCHPK